MYGQGGVGVAEFEAGFARIAGRFARVEPRRRARAFLLGLLSDVDTRSCWQLAEQVGDRSPHRMQRLLGEAVWDADKVRDDVRRYAVGDLGDPAAVLILDDTGDLKAGTHTIGVQRQYTGTAGRIENAQVAVFLAYASRRGYTLIDREVYLPRSWTDDAARLAAAGVPESVRFATKIALARRMLARTLDAGTPAAWCTADEFYGGDRALRRVDQIAATLSSRAWNRYSAGDGAKGARVYDWAWVAITPPEDETLGHHAVLVRRNLSDGELVFYRCWSPTPVGLPALVRVAGTRWCIETCFQTAKGAVGLDEHQVRRWDSWYRYTTLVLTRPRHPHRHRRPGTQPPSVRGPAADSVDRHRNPPPVRQTGRQHRPHHQPLAGLVPLAPPPPSPRQDQPPPSPRPPRTSTNAHTVFPCWTARDSVARPCHGAVSRYARRVSLPIMAYTCHRQSPSFMS